MLLHIVLDIGSSPENKYSENYQSGCLSFEAIYKDSKIICNAGYFQNSDLLLAADCCGFSIPDFHKESTIITDELNDILQKLLQRNITKRYVSAESLLHDLEYHIYRHGYGPTNETLGKFIRSLKGNIDPSPSYESL